MTLLPWVLLGVVGLLIVAYVPKLQMRRLTRSREIPPVEAFKMENEIRKTVSQVVGGFAVLAGLVFTSQQFHLSQDVELADRFIHGVEHLGDQSRSSAQGGILSLQTVAADSRKYSWQVMDSIAGYAQERSPAAHAEGNVQDCFHMDWAGWDIQSAIDVIGQRTWGYDPPDWSPDLSDTNYRGVWFQKYRFDGAGFQRDRLECADFTNAHLAGADFQEAHLEYAVLTGADLKRANMEGAFLTGANLKGADLSQVTGLTWEQRQSAITDKQTRFPDRMKK